MSAAIRAVSHRLSCCPPAAAAGCEEGREKALLGGEGEEVAEPGPGAVVLVQGPLAALLEPVDGGTQQPAGLRVEVRRVVGVRVEQQRIGHGGTPFVEIAQRHAPILICNSLHKQARGPG